MIRTWNKRTQLNEENNLWGGGAGAGRGGSSSVVIHFKDAAFDDSHISVPHNLMSGGKKTERQDI